MGHRLPPIWVGRDYRSGGKFRKRVLILGESTYPAEGERAWRYNVRIPRDHINGHRDRFRTKLVRAFCNSDSETQRDIAEFWNSVAFFNYVAKALPGSRMAPSEEAWGRHQPLRMRLANLKPELVVVLGLRMWDRFLDKPPCEAEPGPLIRGASRSRTIRYTFAAGRRSALAYGMRHPSSGFSWRNEHRYLMRALALA